MRFSAGFPLVLICFTAALLADEPPAATSAAQAPRQRHFHFEYTARVTAAPDGAKAVTLWVPIPHNDKWQSISRMIIQSPQPYKLGKAAPGNLILSIATVPSTLPSVNISFEVVRTEHRLDLNATPDPKIALDAADRKRYLAADRLVPLDDTIRKWAREVVDAAGAHTDLEMARAIYNHVVSTVKYDKSGKGWGKGDIYYACENRRGNCTDFHAIFIGYARAVGIPARFAIGFPIPAERGEGQIEGYHCWAEFFVTGIGWVPVDASEAAKDPSRREYFFGAHDENRVEFTRGRDLNLDPKQAGPPLNFFIYPYAEADGVAIDTIERSFSYKDVK